MRRELTEKESDEIAPVLLVYVPKVKVEIRHRGLTGIAHGFDVLDDCGTEKRQTTSVTLEGRRFRRTQTIE